MMNYSTGTNHQGICPEGWHVPSDEDWKDLEIFLDMSEQTADLTGFRGTDQGTKLKTGGTSGFNATLDGYMTTSDNFIRIRYRKMVSGLPRIYMPVILHKQVLRFTGGTRRLKSYGLSVRCVMDYPFTVSDPDYPVWMASITKWGDYDNDGDMDLYLCGLTTYPNGISDIYRNNGNGTFYSTGHGF